MRALIFADTEPEELAYWRSNFEEHEFEHVRTRKEAVDLLGAGFGPDPDFVVVDITKQSGDGLDALKQIRELRADIPIIALSGTSSPHHVVAAVRSGATDFLLKPLDPGDLGRAIDRFASSCEQGTGDTPGPRLHVMDDAAISQGTYSKRIATLLEHAGATDVPLLLRGETGVGKEVLARKFHARSPRARYPFLKLNCAALPSELVESELFGYERGAFTGAVKNTVGKFEMANGGTILLDEIGDMDFKLQAKLLQVLQDKEFMRLGAAGTTRVDVRVMAATHRDLEEAICAGTFREDLFYRLNIIDIHIPPLRERRDEILPLAEFFLRKHYTPQAPPLEIPAVLRRALLEHDWPGNIRELENVMRKFLVLRSPASIADDLLHKLRRHTGRNSVPGAAAPANNRPTYRDSATPEVAAILEAMKATQWDHAKAALLLGLEYGALLQRMQTLGIQQRPVRGAAVEERAHQPASILSKVNDARKAAESQAILDALTSTRWNRKEAAKLLRIEYKALLYKMKKLGIGDAPVGDTVQNDLPVEVPLSEAPRSFAAGVGERFIA
jgi:DNA-binding NtrC family response regulator